MFKDAAFRFTIILLALLAVDLGIHYLGYSDRIVSIANGIGVVIVYVVFPRKGQEPKTPQKDAGRNPSSN